MNWFAGNFIAISPVSFRGKVIFGNILRLAYNFARINHIM